MTTLFISATKNVYNTVHCLLPLLCSCAGHLHQQRRPRGEAAQTMPSHTKTIMYATMHVAFCRCSAVVLVIYTSRQELEEKLYTPCQVNTLLASARQHCTTTSHSNGVCFFSI
jgi:hypothetical protein